MRTKLLKIALPWLVLALVLPVLALSLTAVPVGAGCGCSGGGDPVPPMTIASVDVSPHGAGDIGIGGQLSYAYPVTQTLLQGATIYLEASPADGYYFVGWSGDLTGNKNPIYVWMNSDKTITALFFPEEIASADNRLQVSFPVGTVVQDRDGAPLADLDIAVSEALLPPPPGAGIVGQPYELGPHGATFDQPVTLNFSYDPSQIHPRVAEGELFMGYYDEEAEQWLVLPSAVDVDNDIVTASVEHLSTFAVIAPEPPPLPAAFTPSELNISPLETDIGETVTVSVVVTNTGEMEGNYSVVLSVNGATLETRDISMAAGSQEVVFSTAGNEAGSYSVEVNGLEGSFTVLEAPLLPIALPEAVVWALLGLAILVLAISAVAFPIISMRRNDYYY